MSTPGINISIATIGAGELTAMLPQAHVLAPQTFVEPEPVPVHARLAFVANVERLMELSEAVRFQLGLGERDDLAGLGIGDLEKAGP